MRKLKRINVPNIQEQLSQSNENQAINKKKLRRFIFMFIFIAAATLYVQFILTKQQEIIVEKKIQLRIKKKLVSLKKDEASLKTNIENLTDDEEEILKFARKEYQFSKSNETIFVLPK
ncbi:septum formation initiator family protein [Bacillus anthracis]|uniref:FtsB family cell division protein n=1 Tax=Bacillus anthracis TaxID=1392 RepID=UPI00227A61F2|nr:septum formation initiator family protein [Bacillus anthracis]MCY2916184.1 septum formation initiator family protein [Bacillus anthracis]